MDWPLRVLIEVYNESVRLAKMMSNNTDRICSRLMAELSLPRAFEPMIRTVYLPLSEIILERQAAGPSLISINGAQGVGKSTLTKFLRHIIETEYDLKVVDLSLDDFYLSRAERITLSGQIHPLLITRGVPGTHDLDLMTDALDALNNRSACKLPLFDKSVDDRCPESEWRASSGDVDIILFEGWCNSSPCQTADELVDPVNELERKEDPDGTWRAYANERLHAYHERIFDHVDMTIMLDARSFERVFEWRSIQESKLAESSRAQASQVMGEAALKRFIQHYERITRHTLANLPSTADIVLPMAEDHSITGIVQHHE